MHHHTAEQLTNELVNMRRRDGRALPTGEKTPMRRKTSVYELEVFGADVERQTLRCLDHGGNILALSEAELNANHGACTLLLEGLVTA